MQSIAIVGGRDDFEIADFLMEIYEETGIPASAVALDNEMDLKELKSVFEKAECKVLLVCIDKNNIRGGVMDGARFNTIVYLKSGGAAPRLFAGPSAALYGGSTIIINSDDKSIFPFFLKKGAALVTCGLNSKASVTVSSLDEDFGREHFQCCIQRNIKTYDGDIIPPQEFPVEISRMKNIQNALVAVAAGIISGVETTCFSKVKENF